MRFLSLVAPFLFLHFTVNAQFFKKDSSAVAIPIIGITYSYQFSGGDLKDRFGNNSTVGGSFLVKDKSNFLWGASGNFMFGDNIESTSFLNDIVNKNGAIINKDGTEAAIELFERGFTVFGHVGKQMPVLNKNSGFYLLIGAGLLQHKIRIENKNDDVPQLDKDYRKGYDRLTNGLALSESIGYRLISDNKVTNFYIEAEFIQGFTQNRRSYNFDTMERDDRKRLDLLMGIKLGWMLPIYKRQPKEYYFY